MGQEALFHFVRIFDRIKKDETRSAFFHVVLSFAEHPKRWLFPLSRGKFSAVHVATSPSARPYADAEFAFKGASDHMRFWFRKPAFEHQLVDEIKLSRSLAPLVFKPNGEVVFDIRSVDDADAVLALAL